MNLTDKQRSILDRAIELLSPLAEAEENRTCYDVVYFKVRGEEVGSEFDTCSDDKCIKKSMKAVRESYGKGTHIEYVWTSNDSDHERIDRCSICGRPLNASLTWINQEFEHHEENTITLSALNDGCSAFDVKVMLESMPSCDHEPSGYEKHQESIGNPDPMKKALKWQEDFVSRVIAYAELVIKILS